MNPRYLHRPQSPRQGQLGAAAISLALLLLVLTGTLLGGQYLSGRGTSAQSDVAAQRIDLEWAENVVNAFAAVHGRLPCPASSRNQAEDCAGGAKGWLPVQTLVRFDTVTSPYSHSRARLDVRYGVYRGTGTGASDADLAVASEAFVPTLADHTPVRGYLGVDTSPLINGLDLCAKLRGLYPSASNRWALAPQLSGGPGRPDRLHIMHDGAPDRILNVAYALALARPSAGAAASALNAVTTSPQFESPTRRHDAQYSDQVRVADVPGLYRSMGCATGMASLDVLAIAQNWTSDVETLHQSTVAAATEALFTAATALYLLADTASVGSASLSLLIAYEKIGVATTGIAATCWDPFTIAQCVAFTAAQPLAITGAVLALLTVATSGISMVMDITVFTAKNLASQAAAKVVGWSGAAAVLRQADQQGLSDE